MKSKLVTMLIFILLAPVLMQARPKTVVDYYNMLGQKITYKKGKWHTEGFVAEIEVKIVDLTNGYIEIEDPGTGGGTVTKTVALFLKKDQTPVLVEFYSNFSGIACGIEYKLTAYTLHNNKMCKAQDILIPLPLDVFFKRGYSATKLRSLGDVANHLKITYKIPRYGTTIEARLDYGCLQWLSSGVSGHRLTTQQRKGIDELIANIKDKPVLLKWDSNKGNFRVFIQ